jgi:DNA invertase Pin-like site-specific DNA recombinase
MSTNSNGRRRCALYLRVSGGPGQTTENQRPELLQLARTRGFEIVAVYDEVGSAVKHRAAFDKMMLSAHRGEFDVLAVWSIDRFGRSMIGNVQAVLDLDRVGVEVVSVREPWLDTSGPVRQLLVAIFSWVASEERRRLIERTKAGLERARREGKQIGRPRARVDMAEARALLASGLSMPKTARKLNVGTSTLYRLLQAERTVREATGAGFPKGSAVTHADDGPEVPEITTGAAA